MIILSRPGGLSAEDRAAIKAAEEAKRLRELDEQERRRRELEEKRMAEEKRPAQPRAEPRQDRDTIPKDLGGIPLERELRRDIMESVRPTGGESREAQAFGSAVEARGEAVDIRSTVGSEDLAYQQRVQEERLRLQQMREDPARWTVETEPGSGEYRPVVGRDIDVREQELRGYEAGYGEWRGSALGGAAELDVYAAGLFTDVDVGSTERGRSARQYEKDLARWKEKAYMPVAKPREGAAGPRRVRDSRSPTMPGEELSLISHDLPADVMPLYTEGTPPTSMEQLLGVAQIPSTLLRGVEAVGAGVIEGLPGNRWYTLRSAVRVEKGVASGAATLVDPATYLGLPGALMATGTYLSSAGWNKISADVSRTLSEYGQSRLAQPELLYQDVGFQIGAALGFKVVTGLGTRALRGTAGALGDLPGDLIGTKGLATISGEGPIPFRQAGQLLRQRSSGLGSDVLGAEGLATIGGEALPTRQLLQVIRQRGSLGSDVLGSRGLAQIGGAAPYPLRQSLEVWARRASLGNLPGEALGGGLARIGGDPALLPIKQLLQVVKQRGSLGSDVLGPTTMGTRGYSLKAMARFFTMPGAVEPFTGVAHRGPTFSTRDISGFLQIKAGEQAKMNAAKVEAFMTREFAPRGAPTGNPVLLQADVRQLVKVGQGVGAVDIFPYEVISFPPRDEFLAREALRRVERPAFVPRQETALKQTLRDAAKLRVGEKPSLLVDQAQQLRQIFKPMAKPRVRQPQALKSAQLQLPGLQLFQAQAQQQKQRQRMMAALAFPAQPRGLRLAMEGGVSSRGGARRRGFRGERRTYPVRDPLDLLESFLEPGGKAHKGKDKRKRRGVNVF